MRRVLVGLALSGMVWALGVPAEAQPSAAAARVGFLSALSPEISGKQLQLLKEIVPRLSRPPSLRLRADHLIE